MNILNLASIIDGTILKESKKPLKKIKIDSRIIEEGDIFVALIGDNNDAHEYIFDVSKKASVVIICKDIDISNIECGVIKVDNTYETLKKLAIYYRNLYKIPLIAITGSVGKTTTKELISSMLLKKYNVLKTIKNYNNHIGLPLTLFEVTNKTDIIVTELGMNHRGEISMLSKLAKPDLSVITNIGSSHIGNLGSKKEIFKEKLEIIDGMKNVNLIVNGFDKFLKKVKFATKIKYKNKQFSIKKIKYYFNYTKFDILYNNESYSVKFNAPGKSMLNNVLLSIEVALRYNIEITDIVDVLNNYVSANSRLEIINKDTYTLINDCYNASYESTIMALKSIKCDKRKKLIILGDLKELGKYSYYYHKKIMKKLKKLKNTKVLLVGEEMRKASRILKKSLYFNNNLEIIEYLSRFNYEDYIILVKGSRKMHLEEIAQSLT